MVFFCSRWGKIVINENGFGLFFHYKDQIKRKPLIQTHPDLLTIIEFARLCVFHSVLQCVEVVCDMLWLVLRISPRGFHVLFLTLALLLNVTALILRQKEKLLYHWNSHFSCWPIQSLLKQQALKTQSSPLSMLPGVKDLLTSPVSVCADRFNEKSKSETWQAENRTFIPPWECHAFCFCKKGK